MRIVIGSRGSKLALWQANWVENQLAAAGYEVEIRIIKTTGDKLQQVSSAQPLPASIAQAVAQAGTKGLFIKEIEEALIAGEVDLAVHSMKDLPTVQPAGLVVAAVPPREDARDVLISRDGRLVGELAARARVGTSSLRRQTQLRFLRADLEVVAMRGNLDTRLKKLDRGDCEALVLAAAGVHRLGLRRRITAYFPLEQMCPAVGQGALALETRQADTRIQRALQPLDHRATHLAVRAERAMLRQLGGGCQVPIAAYAAPEGAQLRLWGVVASHTGDQVLRVTATGPLEDPEHLGAAVAEELLKQGAEAILHAVRAAGL
jgi:hydroxymethylbilane synthase